MSSETNDLTKKIKKQWNSWSNSVKVGVVVFIAGIMFTAVSNIISPSKLNTEEYQEVVMKLEQYLQEDLDYLTVKIESYNTVSLYRDIDDLSNFDDSIENLEWTLDQIDDLNPPNVYEEHADMFKKASAEYRYLTDELVPAIEVNDSNALQNVLNHTDMGDMYFKEAVIIFNETSISIK